jgi:hypothetical protein
MRRWLLRWRRSGRVSLVRRTPRPTPGQRDAARALHRAECARDESRDRRPEVDTAAARLRHHRTENHFAERFRLTMEGGT